MTNSTGKKPTKIDLHVGQIIRQIRRSRGLTQTQLGEVVGLAFQQVQKYERGINRVSAGMLYEIANALDVPIEQFFPGIKPGSNMQFAEVQKLSLQAAREELYSAIRHIDVAIDNSLDSGELRRNRSD